MRIVMKFGGTSLADTSCIRRAARKIKAEWQAGHEVLVVVSAMGKMTDELGRKIYEISPFHDIREYDTVITAGEQISSGLMAIALQEMEVSARSFQGWQVPVLTDGNHGRARVLEIDTELIEQRLEERVVLVCSGFQGIVKETGRVSSLGRGGSDTSAVLFAAAIKAGRCDIYTDVRGVYTADPNIVSKPTLLNRVSYDEMLEMAGLGARVLHVRAVSVARRFNIPLRVLSSLEEGEGTRVVNQEDKMEFSKITAITHEGVVARFTLGNLPDKPRVAATIFQTLAEGGINIDMITQTGALEEGKTNITFTIGIDDSDLAREVLEGEQKNIGFDEISYVSDVAKVSIVGAGMTSNPGVAAHMFKVLGEKNINIQAISTSEIKVSVLIDADSCELAIRALHHSFNLDSDDETD